MEQRLPDLPCHHYFVESSDGAFRLGDEPHRAYGEAGEGCEAFQIPGFRYREDILRRYGREAGITIAPNR